MHQTKKRIKPKNSERQQHLNIRKKFFLVMKKSFWGLNDLSISGRTVLVRVDFNVPLDEQGNIYDDDKIRAAIPTIRFLIQNNARIILMSHLGRPKGIEEKLKMDVIGERLQKLLKSRVIKVNNCVGEDVKVIVQNMHEKDIVLLENLRFYPEEESNSRDFAQALADLADIYVNDAFGTMHRAHASVDAITRFIPSCAGFLVEKELQMLKQVTEKPKSPFVAIIGGAKISDKIKFMEALVDKVDFLLVGGAMMFTFFKGQHKNVGKSLVEPELTNFARKLFVNHKNIVLPVDVVGDTKTDENAKPKLALADSIPDDFIGMDIGPETINLFEKKIRIARTIFWNGPLGKCELKQFSKGTKAIAKAIVSRRCLKIAGGGDSLAIIEKLHLSRKFTHISTGGGATLDFIANGTLPGIIALELSCQNFAKYKQDGII